MQKDDKDIQIEILKKDKSSLLKQVSILRDAIEGCWQKINYLNKQLNDERRKVNSIR
jgi:hypothetical protein